MVHVQGWQQQTFLVVYSTLQKRPTLLLLLLAKVWAGGLDGESSLFRNSRWFEQSQKPLGINTSKDDDDDDADDEQKGSTFRQDVVIVWRRALIKTGGLHSLNSLMIGQSTWMPWIARLVFCEWFRQQQQQTQKLLLFWGITLFWAKATKQLSFFCSDLI